MTKWGELYKRFVKLAEKTGREKSSSYVMNVVFEPDGKILIELGTYDISTWPRNLTIGPFNDEETALLKTEEKIKEAEGEV